MKKLLASLTLMTAMVSASATPTYADIESAMAQHDYKSARTMMTEVLRKRPEAVRAHAINVNLLIAEKASQSDIEAEQVVTRNLVADTVVYPSATATETKSYWLCGVLIVLLTVVSGFAAFLLNEWRVAHKRKKEKVDESDSSNYTTHLSTHTL